MALPEPIPGLVIRYSYLWHIEYRTGLEEGQKDRPCAILAAIRRRGPEGEIRVLVLPVTHRPPGADDAAIEIPTPVKNRLGLDADRSWVILSEWNEFGWPGPDLRRAHGGNETTVAYGMLPPRLFNRIRDQLLSLARSGRARGIPRTE